ncbi:MULTISPECIES: type III secretion system outer membrane ring subunit SctC [unclassified Herbaspirillum]|uniref:type III secretion system outer membrane ring subunit SctC n=1 Tax=unclassified Herbaspirillum TaxID=2624150 RepID=UPI0011713D1F|nr:MULTISPECIES: type III secretion system outer membrane ring subunit SctC [unclassified Herbaspirillum]MBB5390567.1 type III secretion protein C [Herbaspirillum sp. SJZ102]TQK08945.1 type III secretion protein C [Herbaspirillum sp. SJZ130]TQK14368.1 type III secretion protein C [Herbaspirillum sp. SJZ106]TWC66616.1 type III secretion protein C [Herbaspirillum sp. SJZ099]
MKKWSWLSPVWWLGVVFFLSICQVSLAQDLGKTKGAGYVAHQEGLRAFFGGVSAYLGKPIIVSKLAAGMQVSGEFDFEDGDIVGKISRQLGLITYYDGNAIYVYDASETRNSIIRLHHISTRTLADFLKKSGLSDGRYSLRSDDIRTFYVAGPPIYVDLVTQAAQFLDAQEGGVDDQSVEVIKLNNTFVTDRSYTRRDDTIVIPGIATVIEKLLAGEARKASPAPVVNKTTTASPWLDTRIDRTVIPSPESSAIKKAADATASLQAQPQGTGNVRILAYPETNSLLVKGSSEQIRLVRNLVEALDEEKRHVELALWIIDLEKDDLDQLGINWQGSVSLGNRFSASLNAGSGMGAFSTLEGNSFMATVLALAQENKAQIVSRPIVLTQENTPAMFDNSRTFYTPLVAERAVDLQKVTYGTLVNVLPRFTSKGEIELSLNIEDGSEVQRNEGSSKNALPTIGRTKISTVARVPKGKSLLVGGYTRGENGEHIGKIPLLGDLPLVGSLFRYHQALSKNTVRVFLIRPREITEGIDMNADNLQEEMEMEKLIRAKDKTRQTVNQSSEDLYHGS